MTEAGIFSMAASFRGRWISFLAMESLCICTAFITRWRTGNTYISAQGRSTIADKSGFSFVHCNITGTGSAYLSQGVEKELKGGVCSYIHGHLGQSKGMG
ncbi:putative pectinesterase 53 [Platanthera guangdongensis]|uniref:Pectinesterase 53 n=1 Tax=Platanthera guangdongensis TaxID=2320717 RepID=A0ABR2LGF9_9ASPA